MASRGINKVILLGNLGNEPSHTPNENGGIVNISLATSESWRDKNTQEWVEKTEWHRCVGFNKRAEYIANKGLKKGDTVSVIGHLQTRKWQGEDGNDRYTTEIVIDEFQLVSRGAEGQAAQAALAANGGQQNQPAQQQNTPQQNNSQPQNAPVQQQSPIPNKSDAMPQYNEPPMDFDDDIPF
ncbi:single-stranded DNA-binding protein [Vibrio coralliirubri]|uniref:single-stranded DNA-binding protein n=1 Tax=Vibrio coralliirubri TaxID=1516159 RepID=UPI0022835728|nr:single-stranded DNA-binding protein [Vibrio coralliirubri]MCY9860944.1 single-stranded DNA-binding protein [Vibrio coralliirubri]